MNNEDDPAFYEMTPDPEDPPPPPPEPSALNGSDLAACSSSEYALSERASPPLHPSSNASSDAPPSKTITAPQPFAIDQSTIKHYDLYSIQGASQAPSPYSALAQEESKEKYTSGSAALQFC